MTETWLFLHSPPAPAAWNMALDEALLRTAPEGGRPLLRVYSWRQPAVSIGYYQKFPAHLVEKFEIVRRPTGGGLVYHADGVDTTYTVVAPPSHPLCQMNTADAYCAIHQAVAEAVESIAGPTAGGSALQHERVPSRSASISLVSHVEAGRPGNDDKSRSYECFQKPVRVDVVNDGRKLAGGAQRRGKSGMLHQGSIAAIVPAVGLKRAFAKAFGADFGQYRLSRAEHALAEELVRDKYATVAWNQR